MKYDVFISYSSKDQKVVEALDESKMMVVEFNLSDHVDREIELASEDKKPILTYRISDAMFKGAKKYYLKNITGSMPSLIRKLNLLMFLRPSLYPYRQMPARSIECLSRRENL